MAAIRYAGNRTFVLGLIMMLPATGIAAEETYVYVTDQLRLGLYAGEQTTGRPFRTIMSGEKLQILERALMSVRVRTEDGTEGWVKSAYLVDEEPAIVRAAALEREAAAVGEELSAARSNAEAASARIDELEASLAAAQQQIRDLPERQGELEELRAALAAKGNAVPLYWLIGATIGALLLGWFSGYVFLDRKVRKHFGGIRVY